MVWLCGKRLCWVSMFSPFMCVFRWYHLLTLAMYTSNLEDSLQLRIITSTSCFGVWLTWIIMLYNNFGTDDMSLCVCLSYENESWSYFLALAIWHLVSVCLPVSRKWKLVIFFFVLVIWHEWYKTFSILHYDLVLLPSSRSNMLSTLKTTVVWVLFFVFRDPDQRKGHIQDRWKGRIMLSVPL